MMITRLSKMLGTPANGRLHLLYNRLLRYTLENRFKQVALTSSDRHPPLPGNAALTNKFISACQGANIA